MAFIRHETSEGGPLPTTFNMDEDETSGIELVGEFKATEKALTEHSEAFDMDLKYFINAATFCSTGQGNQRKS